MTRKLVVIVFILMSIPTFAQREVFFNSSKPEDFKVQSMKGIELQIGYNPLAIFSSDIYFNPITYYAGFFSEKRIAPTMTLGYSVGLFGSTLKMPTGGYGPSPTYMQVYSLGLRMGIEPRWYWNFKKRAENNKAKLNTGWFLSLPLNYHYLMFSNIKSIYPSSSIYQSYGYLTLKPTFGYRQSITNNIFLESSFGYGIGLSFGSDNGNFYKYFWGTKPELNIKAAYTF